MVFFLDAKELNVLATGMSGNIEYCTIDTDEHKDKFPVRKCPKCNEKLMDKVNLLEFSNIIFDYCTNCHGFFLDKREVKSMNAYLIKNTPSKRSEEIRKTIKNYLVRLDIISDGYAVTDFKSIMIPGRISYGIGNMIHVRIYFQSPLNLGLEVYQEKWSAKLAKLFNLYNGQDIIIGNKEFDSYFIVRSNNENKLRQALTPSIQDKINNFMSSNRSIIKKSGTLKIYDDYIFYTEGPYIDPKEIKDVSDMAEPIINFLIEIAREIEN